MFSTTFGLHRNARLLGDEDALIFGERRQTWTNLLNRVARIAGLLQCLNVERGDRVAVLMLNQDRYAELYLATAWVGAVIVPLNTRWSLPENQAALEDCRPRLLVVDAAFEVAGAALAESIAGLKVLRASDTPAKGLPLKVADFDQLLLNARLIPDAQALEGDLAGIFYTGGTTGHPKGVMLSHRNLMSNARNMLPEFAGAEEMVALHIAPIFHLIGASAFFNHLLAGSTHVFLGSFSPDAIGKAIELHRVTHTALVPTMIQMLLDDPIFRSGDFSSLKRIAYGGSPMSEALIDRVIAALPNVELVQLYGMTELSPVATVLRWKDHIGEGRAKGRHRSGGRAASMVEVRIVDTAGKPIAEGAIGEIAVRGDTVMQGYWERPEETQKAIIDGWMHTGDSGYMDADGYVYIVDRIKDVIVTGGENVYSVEVENCIAQHPQVQQCAVVGIPDQRWGEAMHAVVMRRPGSELRGDDVIAFCKSRIAGYKCPRTAEIRDEPLPLSGAGKILKGDLRRPYWEETAGA